MDKLNFIAPNKKSNTSAKAATQIYLRIAEIRDNTLVLKNGGIRSVLKTSSINFNLKSEQEQDAIIYGYRGFLNSLEFPIQILVRSKKLDIHEYIEGIKKLGDSQTNALLKEQTYEYAQYINKLIEYADIMEKNFYVIVPYNPARATKPGLLEGLMKKFSQKDTYADLQRRNNEFTKLKKGLTQRVNTIKSGLENTGLQVEELNTGALIDLFYTSYNPITSRTIRIKDLDKSDLSA
ncbi:hypothetical protein CVV38_03470 [Candidatus Peregrinibacteria bacterium HGW-Peregrinibacteria-1]|jgi:hypothetical protein|nr:MAG: hypothetical protein CVV38_03470 [Candidatus Peregrinibacteria bacterium HGW-Peregrinibacteria-1]